MRKIVDWWTSDLPYPSGLCLFPLEIWLTVRNEKHLRKINILLKYTTLIRGSVTVVGALLVYVSVLIVDLPWEIRLIMATLGLGLTLLSSIKVNMKKPTKKTTATAIPNTTGVSVDGSEDDDNDRNEVKSRSR